MHIHRLYIPWNSRMKLGGSCLCLIYSTDFGIIKLVALQTFITSVRVCLSHKLPVSSHNIRYVQERCVQWWVGEGGWIHFNKAYTVLVLVPRIFLLTPLWEAVSDLWGRRQVIPPKFNIYFLLLQKGALYCPALTLSVQVLSYYFPVKWKRTIAKNLSRRDRLVQILYERSGKFVPPPIKMKEHTLTSFLNCMPSTKSDFHYLNNLRFTC